MFCKRNATTIKKSTVLSKTVTETFQELATNSLPFHEKYQEDK